MTRIRQGCIGVVLSIAGLMVGIKPASAEFFVGADATNMSYQLKLTSGIETYKIEPARVKAGYMFGIWGIEVQYYGDSDDTLRSAGLDLKLENEDTVAALIRFSDENRYAYANVGIVRTLITNTILPAGPVDKDTVVLVGFSLGAQYELLSNLRVSVDYNYYEGRTDIPSTIATPETSKVDSKFEGFAIGLNYSF